MPHAALSGAVARVGRSLLPDTGATDGQLLGRFAAARDEAAFAALVVRLGPMVLGVCRRGTGDPHLADDAFQAAFLVLARRAADVRPREAVRAFLYGVAVRTAREARSMSARRRSREVTVPAVPDRPCPEFAPPNADALRALDEEVARLPDHLRAAVVLCELDSVSRADAAARLGVPAGTLSSRLAKARKVLADRLRGRGVALSAGGLAALVERSAATAAVPAALTDAAARLAAGSAPAAVTELTRKVYRTMFLTRLKGVAVGAAVALATALGLTAAALRTAPADEPTPAPAAEAAKPAGLNRLLIFSGNRLVLVDPDAMPGTGVEREVAGEGAMWGFLSPDGTRLALDEYVFTPPKGQPQHRRLVIRRLDGTAPDVVVPPPQPGARFMSQMGGWAPDGRRVAVNVLRNQDGTPGPADRAYLYDADAGTYAPVPVLHTPLDWSRDGNSLLTVALVKRDGMYDTRLALLPVAGGKPDYLTPLTHHVPQFGRLSPDGTRLLYTTMPQSATDPDRRSRVYVMGLKDRKPKPVTSPDKESAGLGCAWSPDGKRIAYTRVKTFAHPDEEAAATYAVVVADADGSNPRTVMAGSVVGPLAGRVVKLAVCDWR